METKQMSADYRMGMLIGHILWQSMPVLNINIPKTWNVIKISDEDRSLYEAANKKWHLSQSNEDWYEFRALDESLDEKYLPGIYEKYLEDAFGLTEDMLNGIIDFLWNTDGCTYSLDRNDITFIKYEDVRRTKVTMVWRHSPHFNGPKPVLGLDATQTTFAEDQVILDTVRKELIEYSERRHASTVAGSPQRFRVATIEDMQKYKLAQVRKPN